MDVSMLGEAHAPTDWPKTYQEAVAIQEELRQRVQLAPLARPVRLVAGVDAICDREDKRIFGAAVLYRYPELKLVEEAGAAGECPFPYRTGLLSFREVPILLAALAQLKARPDVVLVDGQGIAHPRGLGLATHLGLVADLPTIGVAKSRLVGEINEPDLAAGSYKRIDMERKTGRIDPADPKGHKAPLCLPWTPRHWAGMSGDHPGLRHPIPAPAAGAAGGYPEPAPASLGPGPETLGRPAGGVEEPLPVQRADAVARVTAPLLPGIPLPPKAILANSPDLLVEAYSSHIPEIDHQPISP